MLIFFVTSNYAAKSEVIDVEIDTPETAKDANPINYTDKSTSTFLIFHGNEDKKYFTKPGKVK